MYINTCISTSFRELQGIWDCSCSIWRTFKLIRVAGIRGDAGTAGRFWVAWAQFWRWMPAASCLATAHACLTSSVAGRRIRLQRYLIWWGGPQECMELRHLDHPGGWWSPRWCQQWQWQIWYRLWIQDASLGFGCVWCWSLESNENSINFCEEVSHQLGQMVSQEAKQGNSHYQLPSCHQVIQTIVVMRRSCRNWYGRCKSLPPSCTAKRLNSRHGRVKIKFH